MFEQQMILSELDFVRLNNLLKKEFHEELELALEKADVTNSASITDDLVTMNSKIKYLNLEDNQEGELSVVYPENANIKEHRISVLAPLGAALIGHRVGDVTECHLPNGQTRRYKVLEILYQPEESGDLHL